ncbi:Uma2 family endonuclease [Larkinella sp.]|uniref:Uma2 family endonuclease n=1 Tax=Larkinella sp. TaxID=2034517 RepID=UPI003BAA4092
METPQYDVFEEFQTEDVMSYNHAKLTYRLTKSLGQYDELFDILPELEFDLSHGRAKPDVAICIPGKANWLKDIIRPTTPPLIAIEILSPRQALSDLTDKALDVYFPSGVTTVWVIIPQFKQVTVLSPTQQEVFTDGILSDEQTGIELSLTSLFKE